MPRRSPPFPPLAELVDDIEVESAPPQGLAPPFNRRPPAVAAQRPRAAHYANAYSAAPAYSYDEPSLFDAEYEDNLTALDHLAAHRPTLNPSPRRASTPRALPTRELSREKPVRE